MVCIPEISKTIQRIISGESNHETTPIWGSRQEGTREKKKPMGNSSMGLRFPSSNLGRMGAERRRVRSLRFKGVRSSGREGGDVLRSVKGKSGRDDRSNAELKAKRRGETSS